MEKTVWELIEKDKFREACVLADAEYSTTKKTFALANKLFALLNLKEYREATNVARAMHELDSHYYGGFSNRVAGVAHWLLNEREEAVQHWQEAVKAVYQDAARVEAPLLLTFAAIKMENRKLLTYSLGLLRKRVKAKRIVNWPGPLAGYLLGLINSDSLTRAISDNPILRVRQNCQAKFYMALLRFKEGDMHAYSAYLKQAAGAHPSCRLELEYYLAVGELGGSTEIRGQTGQTTH